MSAGRLIGVVGPSGVGKDSVMAALVAARPGIHRVRRVITRAPEAGGEDFEPVSREEFERRRAAGAFALHWPAHGLLYGVPWAGIAPLEEGRDCLVNLSRGVLAQARRAFPGLVILHLTAPAEVLAERLAGRGREGREEIAARLLRAGRALPEGLGRVIEIDNSGPLEETVARALRALQRESS